MCKSRHNGERAPPEAELGKELLQPVEGWVSVPVCVCVCARMLQKYSFQRNSNDVLSEVLLPQLPQPLKDIYFFCNQCAVKRCPLELLLFLTLSASHCSSSFPSVVAPPMAAFIISAARIHFLVHFTVWNNSLSGPQVPFSPKESTGLSR